MILIILFSAFLFPSPFFRGKWGKVEGEKRSLVCRAGQRASGKRKGTKPKHKILAVLRAFKDHFQGEKRDIFLVTARYSTSQRGSDEKCSLERKKCRVETSSLCSGPPKSRSGKTGMRFLSGPHPCSLLPAAPSGGGPAPLPIPGCPSISSGDLHQSSSLCEAEELSVFEQILMTVKSFLMAIGCYLASLSAGRSVGDSPGEDQGGTGSRVLL